MTREQTTARGAAAAWPGRQRGGRPPRQLLRLALAAAFLGGLALGTAPASGAGPIQYRDTFYAAGYIGNTGGQPAGLYLILAGKPHGLFLAFKGSWSRYDSDSYYENISYGQVARWGDRMVNEVISSRTYEIGYGRRVAPWAFVYAGVGWATFDCYREHFDPSYILGEDGRYWISYPPKDHDEFDLTTGALLFLSRSFHLIVGYQTAPAGMNLGFGWAGKIN